MIYLDNAATTGVKPASVVAAVNKALSVYSANPGRGGHDPSVRTADAIFRCRKEFSDYFAADNESNVCFLLNCTHAINAVLFGVLSPGDHLIISSLEHNAVYRPANYLTKSRGVSYSIANVDLSDDNITLENIKNHIKNNTKLIFVTAASNVVGKALPLKEIGELCKQRGILFGVDAAQAGGIMPINMQQMNIDYLCVAPHKGFYAPTGVGVLIARKNIEHILISGGTGINSAEPYQPEELPERIESGTVNVPGIIGAGAGVRFVRNKGTEKVYKHEMELCRHLYRKLATLGAELYTDIPEYGSFAPVVSFNLKGSHSEKISELLNKSGIAVRAGLHCSPLAHRQIGTLDAGTVRVSPSVFNSKEDIDRLIFIIKRLI